MVLFSLDVLEFGYILKIDSTGKHNGFGFRRREPEITKIERFSKTISAEEVGDSIAYRLRSHVVIRTLVAVRP